MEKPHPMSEVPPNPANGSILARPLKRSCFCQGALLFEVFDIWIYEAKGIDLRKEFRTERVVGGAESHKGIGILTRRHGGTEVFHRVADLGRGRRSPGS